MLSKQSATPAARARRGNQTCSLSSPQGQAATPTSTPTPFPRSSSSRSRGIQWPVGNPRQRLSQQRVAGQSRDSSRKPGSIQAQVYSSVRTIHTPFEVAAPTTYTSELSLRPGRAKSPQREWQYECPGPSQHTDQPMVLPPAASKASAKGPSSAIPSAPASTTSTSAKSLPVNPPLEQMSLVDPLAHMTVDSTQVQSVPLPQPGTAIKAQAKPSTKPMIHERINLPSKKPVVTEFEDFPYPDPLKVPASVSPEFIAYQGCLRRLCALQNASMQRASEKKQTGRRRSTSSGRNSVWERLSSCSSSDIDTGTRGQGTTKRRAQEQIHHQEQALHDAKDLLHALQHPGPAATRLSLFPSAASKQSGSTAGRPHQGRRASIAHVQQRPDLISPSSPRERTGESDCRGTSIKAQHRPLRRFSSQPIRGSHGSSVHVAASCQSPSEEYHDIGRRSKPSLPITTSTAVHTSRS